MPRGITYRTQIREWSIQYYCEFIVTRKRKWEDYQTEVTSVFPGDFDKDVSPLVPNESTVRAWVRKDNDDYLRQIRPVECMAKEANARDTSGTWELGDSESGEDARLILEVLTEIIDWSYGKQQHFTKGEAMWILKIRKAAPDLDMLRAWLLAILYRTRETLEIETADLDHFVASAPWRSDEARDKYEQRLEKGWVQEFPMMPFFIGIRSPAYLTRFMNRQLNG